MNVSAGVNFSPGMVMTPGLLFVPVCPLMYPLYYKPYSSYTSTILCELHQYIMIFIVTQAMLLYTALIVRCVQQPLLDSISPKCYHYIHTA